MLELNRIYNLDFFEGIESLENDSVDLIITDPPYKTITGEDSNGANSKRPAGMLGGNRKLFRYQQINLSAWIKEAYRVLKNETHCYIFTNSLNLQAMLNESINVGFKLHNLLVWEKNNCTPSQFYMKNCEYILFLRKGKAKWVNDIGGSKTVHKFNNIIGNKKHPCEKPVDLIRFYMLNSSKEDDLVFDPFMGSATTAIAAIQEKRKFIGFELDEHYYNLAKERLEIEMSQLLLGS